MTTAEIVPAENMAALETLDPASRELAVTRMLTEARQWLAHAVEATGPAEIATFKAQMATVAEATKQLGLSREIQLDAQEMVRRAERGLGVAVRQGQEAGEIRTIADGASVREFHRGSVKTSVAEAAAKPSPYDFIPRNEMHGNNAGVAGLVDGVSDEQFEEALSEAREEGNLSRANVVRKARAVKTEPEKITPAERLNKIGDMADAGHTSDQIAKTVGCSEEYVRRLAKENGIDIPADKVMRGTRRIDHTKFVAETVAALEGLSSGLDVLDLSKVDPSQLEYWATSLTNSLRALNRLAKQIKEMTQRD